MGRSLGARESVVVAIVFGAVAVVFIAAFIGTWIANAMDPSDVTPPILARFLVPLAGFFVAGAISFYLRRSPTTPFRWKDAARPVVAGFVVAASMLSVLSPGWALLGVAAVGLGSWSSLASGFWDKEIN